MSYKPANKTHFELRLTNELNTKIERLAEQNGRSKNNEIVKAIETYIEQETTKMTATSTLIEQTDFRVKKVSRTDLTNIIRRVADYGWWTVGAMTIYVTENGELIYAHSQHKQEHLAGYTSCRVIKPKQEPAIIPIAILTADQKNIVNSETWEETAKHINRFLIAPGKQEEENRGMRVGSETELDILSPAHPVE